MIRLRWGKRSLVGGLPRGEFGQQGAALENFRGQTLVTGRVQLIRTGSHDRHGHCIHLQSGAMGRGINAQRQTTANTQTRHRQFPAQLGCCPPPGQA